MFFPNAYDWIEGAALYMASAGMFFVLRLYPLWPGRFQGCDAYNILLCAEALRQTRRLPIVVPPVFMLEAQEQWYPPGFLVLCALVPENWLKRYYWLVNQVIDFLNISVAGLFLFALGQPWVAAAIFVFYAMQFGLIHEYSSLNTRPLGTLLLTAFLLLSYLGLERPWIAACAAIVGVALFYSHKLSLQQTWFTLPALALFCADWRWLAWLPAIYLLSFLIWPRGFLRIVGGHSAIISFWHRHWPLLGAHQVKQSPIYGDGKTQTEFYATDGWRGFVAFARDAVQQNFFVAAAVAAAWLSPHDLLFERFLLGWIGSVYLAAMLIHVVPQLRGIGLGRQYIKFALVPTAILLAETLDGASWTVWLLIAAAAVLTTLQYVLTARSIRRSSFGQTGQLSADLAKILAPIKADEKIWIMCLPLHLCDLVAYQTRARVYWGAHSDCFDEKLAQLFPVLRRRIEEYAADDALTHLLIDTRYASLLELGLSGDRMIAQVGPYVLHDIAVSAPRSVS